MSQTTWWAAAAGAICVAVGVVAAALFLPHQSLWNDEATQLCGLTLAPVEVTRWLAGWSPHDFGVPDDRMPPLSYWAGWVWARVFGLSEVALRWFGVVNAAAATAVVFAAGRRAWGLGAGVAAALLLATSPNVATIAVEVRAYPLFLLASAVAFYGLLRYLEEPAEGAGGGRSGWLALMSACGVAAMYLHFFGLVLAGGLFFALGLRALRRREPPRPIVLAALPVAIAAPGLIPFVIASTHISTEKALSAAEKLRGGVKLVYRLASHPAIATSAAALGVVLLGALLSLAAALTLKRRGAPKSWPIAVAIVAGLVVAIAVRFATTSLDATNPSYNVWMLPGVALLLCSGLASRGPATRKVSALGLTLMVAGNLYGAAQLAVNGDAFAHTPARHLIAMVRQLGVDRVTVLHDDGPMAAMPYYPLRYEFQGALGQFFAAPGGRHGVRLWNLDRQEIDRAPAGDHVIVVHTVNQSAEEIADQLRHGVRPLDDRLGRALEASGRWVETEHRIMLSFYKCDVRLFHKAPVPAPPPTRPQPRVPATAGAPG
jgi:4-amino-4-deoxy-L-arabinose transferase-like glycosyltransferase